MYIQHEKLYTVRLLSIGNLSFIMSFQGEPGVRGPPGPSGPRGIGTQGPKVSHQVSDVSEHQVSVGTSLTGKV